MSTILITILCLLIGFWIFCNIVVAIKMSKKEMLEDFCESNIAGKIMGGAYYMPAYIIASIKERR